MPLKQGAWSIHTIRGVDMLTKEKTDKIVTMLDLGYSVEAIATASGESIYLVKRVKAEHFGAANTRVPIHAAIAQALGKEISKAASTGVPAYELCTTLKISVYQLRQMDIVSTKSFLVIKEDKDKALHALVTKANSFGAVGSEEWEAGVRKAAAEHRKNISLPPNVEVEVVEDEEEVAETPEEDTGVYIPPASLEVKLGTPVLRRAAIVYLYNNLKIPLRELGTMLNLSHETIRTELAKAGCKVRPVGKRRS